MQEVARSAIAQYVSNRPERMRAAIERVRTEDAELLDRLSRRPNRRSITSALKTSWRSPSAFSTTS